MDHDFVRSVFDVVLTNFSRFEFSHPLWSLWHNNERGIIFGDFGGRVRSYPLPDSAGALVIDREEALHGVCEA